MIHILIMLVVLFVHIQVSKCEKPMNGWTNEEWGWLLITSLIYPIGILYIVVYLIVYTTAYIYEWYDSVEWTKERSWRKNK